MPFLSMDSASKNKLLEKSEKMTGGLSFDILDGGFIGLR
jgi:hypothetical protein